MIEKVGILLGGLGLIMLAISVILNTLTIKELKKQNEDMSSQLQLLTEDVARVHKEFPSMLSLVIHKVRNTSTKREGRP